jgi:glycosyltransferase involved in cell wall biosynthesis
MSGDTVGGVFAYALELARALLPYGTEVTLATMGGAATAAQRAEAAAVGNVMLVDRDFKLEWMADPWDDVARAGEWLLELAARVAPDVVHLNHYAHGTLPWPAPVVMVGHSDVLSWFRAVRAVEAPASWDRYRRVVGEGLRAAARVVAPTQALLSSLAADYGPFAAAVVIANGRDPARYVPAEEKTPLVLAAGRFWDDAKNLAALDEVTPRVRWPIVVAGPLEHPDAGGGAREPRHARALGRCCADEMQALYARAAIYALPARYEPFGLSILEAALSGCALVLGDIPSLRELWDGAAQFVAPDDANALTAAIERFIGDGRLRHDYASAARRRALAFSPARMAADYLALYRQVLAAEEAACA